LAVKLELYVDGSPVKILNISETGVRYIAKDELDTESVDLTLQCQGQAFRLRGRRAWGESVGPSHTAVGVAFQEEGDLSKLKNLLAEGTLQGGDRTRDLDFS